VCSVTGDRPLRHNLGSGLAAFMFVHLPSCRLSRGPHVR
jgi:hypothetical protein